MVDNTKMDLTEIQWEGIDCIHLAQNRDHYQAAVNTIMKFWVI
jgi:hypothetical protein